ncbi:hypothetical protein SLEP1_g26952 [Rubroshorea leprosula]|uniref:Uncharacterized protein n=1 Tax=Rubroshorea leprosula TaxID=152421 RepID=A0AAV5JRM2_9ROSI|nr:hypothetical protein SLEP1_g26952 [Rubroshorea leprosula]
MKNHKNNGLGSCELDNDDIRRRVEEFIAKAYRERRAEQSRMDKAEVRTGFTPPWDVFNSSAEMVLTIARVTNVGYIAVCPFVKATQNV